MPIAIANAIANTHRQHPSLIAIAIAIAIANVNRPTPTPHANTHRLAPSVPCQRPSFFGTPAPQGRNKSA